MPSFPKTDLRVLLLEDDAYVRDICARTLTKLGCRVVPLADSEVAWVQLLAGGVDILVSDHHMPKITGLELIRRMRLKRMRLPAVLISGNMPTSARAELDDLGCADLLHKPFSIPELISAMQRAMTIKCRPVEGPASRP